MKNTFVILLLLFLCSLTYGQTTSGNLNYIVYNTYNSLGGRGYANSSTDFVNMFDVTKGAVIYRSGTTTAQNALYISNNFIANVPNGGSYFGIKVTGYFIPKETGAYSFGIDGDDGVDFSLNGNVVTSYYGPHGFGGYHYGSINLVAGQTYTFMARMQQSGGGWGMYAAWKRPSQTTYSIQSNEVYSSPPPTPTKKAVVNFNFNTTIDATKFSIGTSVLDTKGSINITNNLDSTKIANGYKGTIVGGGVEWTYVDFNNGSFLHIDVRKFGNTTPSDVTYVKLLDVYDGAVTFISNDGTWANYSISDPLTKVTDGTSTNSQYIRNGGGYYGIACDVTFASAMVYKQQSVSLTTTNNLSTLYNTIVTVSDVYLAFKEYSNQGIMGNQTGVEFINGIQYLNADVNGDGTFDESDCFALLQNLTGVKSIVDTFNLNKTLKLIPLTTYNSISKSNWNSYPTYLGSSYSFDMNTGKSTDTLNVAISWKGDVNMSHSLLQTTKSTSISNQIQSSIITELNDGKVYAYINLDPLQQEVVGTQFQLNYDNTVLKFEKVDYTTKGNPTNYGTNKGDYVNVGSLVSDGTTTLDNTTEYKITFTPIKPITNTLGLISVGSTDAVNKSGLQLNIKIN